MFTPHTSRVARQLTCAAAVDAVRIEDPALPGLGRKERTVKRHITLLLALGFVLAACRDGSSPLAPVVPRTALLSQGGAPTPVSSAPTFDPFISTICGFPVLSGFAGKLKTLSFPDGRTIFIAPADISTFVNGFTGKTVTRSQTGAVHLNPLLDGSIELVLTGHNAVVDDVLGYAVYLSGRFTLVIGPDGNIAQRLAGNGLRTDICALLS